MKNVKKQLLAAAIAAALLTQVIACVKYVDPPVIITDEPPVTVTPEESENDETGQAEPAEPDNPLDGPWRVFTHELIRHSFEIPEDWTAEFIGGSPGTNSQEFAIFSPDDDIDPKLHFWTLSFESNLTCGSSPEIVTVEEVYSEPIAGLDPLRFVYRVAHAEGKPFIGSVAITGVDWDLSGSCGFVNISYSEPGLFADAIRVSYANPEYNLDHEFESRQEAVDFMESIDYKTLKRILTSLKAK